MSCSLNRLLARAFEIGAMDSFGERLTSKVWKRGKLDRKADEGVSKWLTRGNEVAIETELDRVNSCGRSQEGKGGLISHGRMVLEECFPRT